MRRCAVLLAVAALAGLAAPAAAPARRAPPRAFFGMQAVDIGAYLYDPGAWDRDLAAMRRLGIGTYRQPFDRRYPVHALDAFVLAAARHQIRLLPVVLDTRTYRVEPGPGHGMLGPRKPKRFAAFAGRLAARFGPHGTLWQGANAHLRRYAVREWQIWNEPNLPTWWRQGPNPRAYLRVVRAAGRSIRRHEPRARIVAAGIPDSRQSRPLDYRHYLTRFLRAGGGHAVDVLGANAYAPSVAGVKRILRTYRRLLDRHRGRRVRLQITELGWADRGHRNPMVVGRRGTATRIRRAYAMVGRLRRRYAIDGIMWFDWRDYRPSPGDFRGDTWGFHTGLLTASGRRKPAYGALRRAIRRLR